MSGCNDSDTSSASDPSGLPIHLEDRLDSARIESSALPTDLPPAVEWEFDQAQPDWKVVTPFDPTLEPARLEPTENGLLLLRGEGDAGPTAIYVDLPDWNREDWASVLVRARTSDEVGTLSIGFNLRSNPGERDNEQGPFLFMGDSVPIIKDGAEHTYLLRADWSWDWEGPWKQLGLLLSAGEKARVELLAVKVIPKASLFAAESIGVTTIVKNDSHRRVLFTHTPSMIEFPVMVPPGGQLDVGLGSIRADHPVQFSVKVVSEDGTETTLLSESYADKDRWAQRSIDLSAFGNKSVTVALETDSDRAGAVALWAAPTISGARATEKPNVIFYIIDGAGADYMSLYGYNRRTTPNLERLASESAVFERAYSNSTWSKPSTPSFMTSLQHSVLGGYISDSDPLPYQAVTMAEHLHRAGYQTAVFTSNPYAGTLSSLERGTDRLREADVEPNSMSSAELHADFWTWRRDYPGQPYWAHFQTTDVHWPYEPSAPFAGMFLSPQERETFLQWERSLWKASGLKGPTWPSGYPREAFEETDIDPEAFYDAIRSSYDETMAHNDFQIGRLIERLKAAGEWENTLFIVAADHGTNHGFRLHEPWPRRHPLFTSYISRIPMLIHWPTRIPGGKRFSEPVSMIDMLPTVLDLCELPLPEVMQGQSLAPLLLGEPGWEWRPVITEEVYVDWDTGELSGQIGMIDTRWGATLSFGDWVPDPESPGAWGDFGLYDFWNDPFSLKEVHAQYPDVTEKYRRLLQDEWQDHLRLAEGFKRAPGAPVNAEQLETLRSLGYIR